MNSNKLLAVGIVMHLLTMAITLFAETEKVGDYTWQYFVRDGKAWIGSQVTETAAIFPKPVGEVTVPSELGGYEVFRLDSYALYGCDEMTKLVIPDCVRQMGGSAVAGCSALGEVLLSKNLEYVAGKSFCDCTSLKEMLIPERVEKIDARAFQGCTSLTNVVIPSSVRRIGQDAFYNCKSLTDVIVPNSVTNIDKYAFSCCTGLRSLALPFIGSQRGNTGTEESVFGHLFGVSAYEGLTNVVQAYSYESNTITVKRYIPSSLKRITITDETVIAKGAFDNCRCVKNIIVNDGICHVGEYAFAHCRNLIGMVIPDSVTNIEQRIFADCGSLERLTLPFVGSRRGNDKTAECAFGWIFGELLPVSSLDVDEFIHIRQWVNGANFWCYIPKSLKSVVVTDETIVAACSFDSCHNLENIVIGDSVTNIQERAFAACQGLQNLTLPFVGAKRDALSGTQESMFGYIFGVKPGEGLVQVRQSLGVSGVSGWTTNYISAALTDVTVKDEKSLGYGSFYGCSMLTNVALNSEIETIGGYAFRNCTGIRQIDLPSGLHTLDVAAFRGSGLETVFVPLSVTNMAGWVFESCKSLRLAYVPRRFKGNLGYNTFANCADDLQIIYYDENMRFFDETLATEDGSSTNIVAVCTNDCRVSFEWKCSCEPLFKNNP